MKEYNGFSGAFRAKVGRLLNKAIFEGKLKAPEKCCICGQDQGTMHYHLEDYSRPFEELREICVGCHMKLHMRFEYPNLWKQHLHEVRLGRKSPPYKNTSQFFNKLRLLNITKDIDFVPMVDNPNTWYEDLPLITRNKYITDEKSPDLQPDRTLGLD